MNKKLSFNFFSLLVIVIFLLLPFFVFSENDSEDMQNLTDDNPLSVMQKIGSEYGPYSPDTDSNTVFTSVGLIINVVLGLLSVVFLILIIISGINWMTASGNEESITKAKTILKQAIIGLLIVISSWGIWEIIARIWLSNL